MFLHLCVILFTGGKGVCPPHPTPPRRPTWGGGQTPLGWSYPPSGCRPPPLDEEPVGWANPLDEDRLGWADPLDADPLPPGLGRLPSPDGDPRPHRYGQQAGGTHPTGMHTCFLHFHVDIWTERG